MDVYCSSDQRRVLGEKKLPICPASHKMDPREACKVSLSTISDRQTDRSTPDSLCDSSGSSDYYRALGRKYVLLEEESLMQR
ncbi:unnamed protein product [Musa acuminata subsp. malaccensis]|uniref:(wild Malaysian banana) hypothetical protein n=1 Tax=Musa acuminata subsp. malaccensis TaxID=214687 RepID=A0A8D7FSU3_MUSAM|nr:unnamed protein product [Musa acuminata subsp. malaccensis]